MNHGGVTGGVRKNFELETGTAQRSILKFHNCSPKVHCDNVLPENVAITIPGL